MTPNNGIPIYKPFNSANIMKTTHDYTQMQKNYYEAETPRMKIENHMHHNVNPDYWNLLLQPLQNDDWTTKVVLDFGCGCGRNVQNIVNTVEVKEVHGCDISSNNIQYCQDSTPLVVGNKTNFKFITVDGQSLQPLESDSYDLIISTIVLQHICVHSIRKSILTDMYRCLKPGGLISLQMGFGGGHPNTANYFEDATHAMGTNSAHDVRVESPDQIGGDLNEIGFIDFKYVVSNAWDDSHSNWIYFTAKKPLV